MGYLKIHVPSKLHQYPPAHALSFTLYEYPAQAEGLGGATRPKAGNNLNYCKAGPHTLEGPIRRVASSARNLFKYLVQNAPRGILIQKESTFGWLAEEGTFGASADSDTSAPAPARYIRRGGLVLPPPAP
uniref:Uncharacterized protein n=1 Tax=Coconut foliar decay alphasatellite 4 TaxID=2161877 RepID=A0A2R4N9F6_9VIRU|nr:hypothetical protein [Coconut foliar decay alphasatellite 4]